MYDFFFPFLRSACTAFDMRSGCGIWAGCWHQRAGTSTKHATYHRGPGRVEAHLGHDHVAHWQFGGNVLGAGHAGCVLWWLVVSDRKAARRRAIAAVQLPQPSVYSPCGVRQPEAADVLRSSDGLHKRAVVIAFDNSGRTVYISDSIHFVFLFRRKRLEHKKLFDPAYAARCKSDAYANTYPRQTSAPHRHSMLCRPSRFLLILGAIPLLYESVSWSPYSMVFFARTYMVGMWQLASNCLMNLQFGSQLWFCSEAKSAPVWCTVLKAPAYNEAGELAQARRQSGTRTESTPRAQLTLPIQKVLI
jgi:hypothetical protein